MTGLEIMLIAIVVLAFGYFGYAKWLEKTWGIDLKCLRISSRQLPVRVP